MKTVELEKLATAVIIIFLDSLEELGCTEHPVEWFKNLPDEEKLNIGSKFIEIIERQNNE